MKKMLKKTWIGLVAIFAVVVAACCTHKNSPQESNTDPSNTESQDHQMTKKELRQRIAAIREELKRREGACVYGSPEVLERWGQETRRLRHEADSLQNLLDNYGKK